VALGNRRYFSNEECDSCNETYADAHDSHLINSLAVQRLLFGVRGREGYIGLKPGKIDASVIRATGDRHISIWRTEGDNGVDFQLFEGNRGRLSFGVPGYRPMCMLQSLLRSCWLLADVAFRQRHPYILQWIKQAIPTPTKILTYTILDGEFQFAELTLWERSARIDGALLELQFVFCNTIVLWVMPSESGMQTPSLLPPFVIGNRPPEVRLSTISSPDAEVWDIRTQFEFTYDSKIEATADEADRLTKATSQIDLPATSIPVLVHLERSAKFRGSLHSLLTADHHDPFMWRLRVSGGQFAGTMALEINTQDGNVRFDVKLLPHLVSPADVLATLEFLRDLEFGGDLSFRDERTAAILFTGHATTLSPVTQGLDTVLRALASINEAFGTDLRYPQKADAFDWEALFEINAIISGYPIERGPGSMTMRLDDASALRRALAETPQGVTMTIEHHDVQADISGIRLDLGVRNTEVVGARIGTTNGEPDANTVRVEFENVVERFSRWTRGEGRE